MSEKLFIPKNLEKAIQKNNLVFFIGAGCSMTLDFPSWKQLIEDILQELIDKYGKTSSTNFQNILNDIKNEKSLFDALNKIENDSDHGHIYKIKAKEFINAKIEDISKKLPDESLVHSLLWKISEKIITTNYDTLLEKYKPSNISPKIFDNTNAFQGLKSHSGDAQFLYKIHGDYDKPESIILFESDYRDIYKSKNYNNDTLATHFKEKTLLFIGFSLTDPFVIDLFSKVKTIYKRHTVNEHFIFTTKSEDFTEYDVTAISINDWEESLLNYLTELEKIKLNSSKIHNNTPTVIEEISDKELTKDDVSNIIQLIDKKTNELLSNPSDKELNKEVRDLRNKLDKLLFGKIDYLREVDKPFRNFDLQALFDTIYSSEKLSPQTLDHIRKVRNNTEIYNWYDRSVIVSAITCSLIHFNKADEQKITLLIDFANDNEKKVWEKAITSLFVVLNHLGNKWLRFTSITTKIKSLNENSRIQDACSKIVSLFSIGLNNVSMISEELFSNPYFSENPFNYFLPYHQEANPAFDLVYETYEGNDIEKFIMILNQVPIPDQVKYLLCGRTKEEEEEENVEDNENMSSDLNKILHYNSLFYPYSIYVQEIISFYKYFPIFNHKEKLKSELKLTETPLKDYLLNAKEKYSALGSHFMQNKNWAQAIVNYKESIKLDEKDVLNLLNLANCYHKNEDYIGEFSLRIKIKNLEDSNEWNLRSLFNLYWKINKDFNNSLIIAEQLVTIDPENSDYFNFRGASYKELKEYDKAIENYSKAIEISPDESMFFSNRASVYYLLKEFNLAILDWNKAIYINPKNDTNYFNLSLIFYQQKKYEESNIELNTAISINEKDTDYLLNRATNNLYLSRFDEFLIDIKKADSLGAKKDIIYHRYANYYRLTHDFEKAFEYIEKAENLEKNNTHIGTKATIYASIGDDDNFYKYLEEAFIEGAEANSLFPDIKEKYQDEIKFIKILQKYDQKLF